MTSKTKLIFATHNQNKAAEIQELLSNNFEVLTLNQLGYFNEIVEDAATLEGNASIKSKTVFHKFGLAVFADDTGLEVPALNNEPGVYSARYAGEQKNSNDNMNLLLTKLKGKQNRSANFRTVISFIWKGEEHLFEGRVDGQISETKSGTAGFGYDPIFIPDGFTISFAEMAKEDKNSISHRGQAIAKMVAFLEKQD
ncbi:MAG: XTP/dITP diphosphohydrolase [Bacteroidia bacterium]|jgi:XTP/dITP diphosphohydrolase